ncbi:hypothetical protein ACFL1X_11755 [Candidatus Hydrogenedentota bacterium]
MKGSSLKVLGLLVMVAVTLPLMGVGCPEPITGDIVMDVSTAALAVSTGTATATFTITDVDVADYADLEVSNTALAWDASVPEGSDVTVTDVTPALVSGTGDATIQVELNDTATASGSVELTVSSTNATGVLADDGDEVLNADDVAVYAPVVVTVTYSVSAPATVQ